jgi:uncharacterized protein (TIGR02271 family)
MTARKIVGVFDTSEAAQTARTRLIEMGIPGDQITIADQSSLGERKVQTPHARGTFWAHLKAMFMPDHDRHTYEESMRRGGCMLVATVDDDAAEEAIRCLERAGAVDLDEREARWRSEGWQPAADREVSSNARATQSEPRDATARDRIDTSEAANEPSALGRENLAKGEPARIPVVEERLRVGKREVNRGSVRVRSYIVEEPVHEEVRLREEHVSVERRPVNQPARPVVKGSPEDLLQERTVEVTETAEQAVVGKEARVTEQVVVSKATNERVEPIDDTVRRTKVEVEDDRHTDPAAQSASPTRNAPPPGRA